VKKRLAELEEEKKRLYTQMEIDEDERDSEHEINAIRWLSDVVQSATKRDAVLSEGEEFDMDVDMRNNSDSNGEHPEKKEQVSSTCPIHVRA
jgi:restriction endonuclease S subunit